MMDGEDVYRARMLACLAAAEASSLPQVRARHLAAAKSWAALLDATLERERLSAGSRTATAATDAEDDGSAEMRADRTPVP